VFPGGYAEPQRVVAQVAPPAPAGEGRVRKPLFVLLDATWAEARRMFRKSPYLDALPVLGLRPEQSSRYRLRQSADAAHLCTLEVAALCMALAGETHAAQVMEAYLDIFTHHYLQAKHQRPVDTTGALHQHLRTLKGLQEAEADS